MDGWKITPDVARIDVEKILALEHYRLPRYRFGVAFGTDTGGFASLPGPDGAERHLQA